MKFKFLIYIGVGIVLIVMLAIVLIQPAFKQKIPQPSSAKEAKKTAVPPPGSDLTTSPKQAMKSIKDIKLVELEKKVASNPEDLGLRRRLCNMYFNNRMYIRAKEEAKFIIRRKPNDFVANYILFNIYVEEDNPKKIIRYGEILENISPPDLDFGKIFLIQAYIKESKFNEAAKRLKKLLEANPDAKTLRMYGYLSLKLGDYQKAVESYKKAIELEPQISSYFNYALALQNLGKDERKVEEIYQKIIDTIPVFAMSANNLAFYYVDSVPLLAQTPEDTEKLKKAEKLLDFAIKIYPDEAFVLDTKGWLELKQQNIYEAQKYLEQAHYAFPQNPRVLYHLGVLYYKMGFSKKAIAYLKEALNKNLRGKDRMECQQLLNYLSPH